MNKVLILMSTHNGRERILKQVDSILKQNSVDVSICIRDDGSDKETKDILNRLSNGYSGKVSVLYGRNIGWKQSFLELVYDVDNSFDYYGFSDQDDIWLSDKVINCIHIAEKDKFIGPKLIHCNSLSVTSNLEKDLNKNIGFLNRRLLKKQLLQSTFKAVEYFGTTRQCVCFKVIDHQIKILLMIIGLV